MDQVVDLNKPTGVEQSVPTVEDVRRLIAQARADDHQRPINIQINLGDGGDRSRLHRDEAELRLSRSKLFWVVVVFSLAVGVSYARTRYVCQSFKDNGQFFYGMGVDRCVGVLIKRPFAQIQTQLETINRSY